MRLSAETLGASGPPKEAALPRKRAYHKKVRTGCVTCKIRRLRCDETKPACTRCTSTGRKCDGYEPPPTSSSASPPKGPDSASLSHGVSPSQRRSTILDAAARPSADVRLLLPRMDPREVRSYRYFLAVVAPGLSGFFDADFWLDQIPRVASSDASIWHAIVSLGAAHECSGAPLHMQDRKLAIFALNQFNKTIQGLTEKSSPRYGDRGRALTVSTIFACLSVIEGNYQTANVHLQAGCKLLRELDGDDLNPVSKGQSELQSAPTTLESLPVCIPPIRNFLSRMEMVRKAVAHGSFAGSSPASEILNHHIFKVWKEYTCPAPSTGRVSMLTPEVVLEANKAGESLVNGLVYATQEQAESLASLISGEGDCTGDAAWIRSTQRTHTRGYKELRKALLLFEAELEKPECGSPRGTREQLRNAIRPLRLFLCVCRMVFITDPEAPTTAERMKGMPDLCETMMENADIIISSDETLMEVNGKKFAFTTSPTTLDALFLVAHSGPTFKIRRRAADMLRRPTLEGMWHTMMTANLADAVMDRELEALVEYKIQLGKEDAGASIEGLRLGSDGKVDLNYLDPEDTLPHALYRVRTISMDFVGTRQAEVRLQTWGDHMDGIWGRRVIVNW